MNEPALKLAHTLRSYTAPMLCCQVQVLPTYHVACTEHNAKGYKLVFPSHSAGKMPLEHNQTGVRHE